MVREEALRRLAASGIAILVAGCAAQPPETPPPSPSAAVAVSGRGCVGRSVETCVGSLTASLSIDKGLLTSTLAERGRTDVSGSPIPARPIVVAGGLPGREERLVILLHPSADGTIAGAEATLLDDPTLARTEQDYDRTGLYEVVSRLLGRRCPQADRIQVYRFFENSVKPRIVTERAHGKRGIFAARNTVLSRAAKIPFCGVRFSFAKLVTWKGTADATELRKFVTVSTIRLDQE
jgi:hypothetical protein